MDSLMVYTVKDVAVILHTSPNYIYELIENGFLPAIKLGSIKILKTTLEKFLIENEGNDLSDPKNLKKMVIKEVDSNGEYKY